MTSGRRSGCMVGQFAVCVLRPSESQHCFFLTPPKPQSFFEPNQEVAVADQKTFTGAIWGTMKWVVLLDTDKRPICHLGIGTGYLPGCMKPDFYSLSLSLWLFLSSALYSLWHNFTGTSLPVQFTNLPHKVLNLFNYFTPILFHRSLNHLHLILVQPCDKWFSPSFWHLLVHSSKFITFSNPLTATKGLLRGLPWSRGASCSSLWADKGLGRGTGGKSEGVDGVVTSEAGREIEEDDERGEIKRKIKRGMPTEQKRKSKKGEMWSGRWLQVDNGSQPVNVDVRWGMDRGGGEGWDSKMTEIGRENSNHL